MTTPPGWHPDPSGRHQHRFWDGSGWTDQVSDDGVQSTDPVDAPAAPTMATGGDSTAADPWAGTSAAPGSGSGKSKAPMFVGIAVVVALIAGGIFLLTNRDSGSSSSSGTGDHTLTVGTEELTTHSFDAKAGDFVFLGYDNGDRVTGALGLPRSAADEMVELDDTWGDTSELFTDSNNLAARLFSDLVPDDAEMEGDLLSLPGFDGVVVTGAYNEFDGSEERTAMTLVSPIDTTYTVALLSDDGEVEVDLNIRVETPDEVPDTIDEDSIRSLYESDEMRDFRERMAEEFGLTMGGGLGTDEFTDDFTDWSDEFTDDFTDWSDEFTDDFTDWSDEFTDDFTDDWTDWSDEFTDWSDDWTDWSDWSDEWSDLDSQFSDLMTELDDQLSN